MHDARFVSDLEHVEDRPHDRQQLDLGNGRAVLDSVLDRSAPVVLIAAGVGLLRLRRFGRSLALIVAALQVVSSVAGLVFLATEIAAQPNDGRSVTLASNAGAVIGKILGAAFPIVTDYQSQWGKLWGK